jgi:hypothetical protein
LRSLVIPLEEEIQALKEKLRYTDQQLRKYEGDKVNKEYSSVNLRFKGICSKVQGDSNMTGTDLCVNKSQFVPVIFEPPCNIFVHQNRNLPLLEYLHVHEETDINSL